jgi:GT2 family glycosyltransferase
MITVVTIYNKKDFLERVLLDSLRKQTAPFELIAVDNTAGKYKSAAAAFNAEARRARGEYVLFAHQDVDFGEDTEWLAKVETYLTTLENPGIIGFAGFDFNGNFRGYLSSCGADLGQKESSAVEVQTLDGYLFIIPKKVLETFSFDEKTFDGWHLYADDYCLTTQQHGLKTYVPFFTYHQTFP